MGAHESEAMRKARELVLIQGVAPSKAAVQAGLTLGAIMKTEWYRALEKPPRESDRMKEARRLITEEGRTAAHAAKVLGLSQAGISRKVWYREYKEDAK